MKNNYFVHKSAFVDVGARIGQGTKIWHHVHITKTAIIGENCNIGKNCYIAGKIGRNCRLQNNVNVYLGVELGDFVFCGPSMTFTNDYIPRAKYPKQGNYLKTKIKKGAAFGANSTILCGITIGRHAFIGAGSVVTRSVPDYALVYGNPAKIKGWICECGEKLAKEFSKTTCKNCKRRYEKKGLKIIHINQKRE